MNTLSHNPMPTVPAIARWYQQNPGSRFLCLPMAAVMDRRLKHEALRILMALAMHADANGKCFPGRELISQLTGIHPSNVSKATRLLAKLGWLSKQQHKGRSVTYYLRTPNKQPAKENAELRVDPEALSANENPKAETR